MDGDSIAQQKAQLAQLRSQVAELELRLVGRGRRRFLFELRLVALGHLC